MFKKCIFSHISDKKDKQSVAVINVMKKSAIAGHLLNYKFFETNFYISKLIIMRQRSNTL